ncbi:unnamed protein product [Spirodela intermedia]|uniref:RNA-dependent RNA polymerase n=1 Tax=Spirodela intermedia TaxID=51605 RepID=A0A7I8J3C2_SPIIN|nr:unnamed protein product [Spirodela intermedia]CAA6664758.1 unnamed protein product [Spirodela intermedia]
MVQNGTLSGPTLDDEFFGLLNPDLVPRCYIEYALERLSHSKTCWFTPALFLSEQYEKLLKSKHEMTSGRISLLPGLVYVHRDHITPSKVYFYGPKINVSNRVIRQYKDDLETSCGFPLLTRMERGCGPLIYCLACLQEDSVHTEERHNYRGKRFDFLVFSASQLKDSSVWMFASRPGLCAADIRRSMGNFSHIRNVAKYAARLGQSFGSSTETLVVSRHEVEMIPDVENAGGYLFSDGIGKISATFAKEVAVKCDQRITTSSAFQIRYGGFKGVVAMDPTSRVKLSLRKSMSKFDSNNTKLDVLAYSKPQACYLNRQLITLLSTLGINDQVFGRKQEELVAQLDKMLTDPVKALEFLNTINHGEMVGILKEMLLCGYSPGEEPFLSMMLWTFRASRLLELRTRSRIFIPMGRSMMGCLDETRTLEYGEVFVQVSLRAPEVATAPVWPLSLGEVIVSKNPCLHPGDLRTLLAVDVPALHHMVDCVVFPQKGERSYIYMDHFDIPFFNSSLVSVLCNFFEIRRPLCYRRPHPNECSGSDLDGDVYFVSWDPELTPPRQVPPMDYTPVPQATLNRDVMIEDVEEYFANYIVNNSLGVISNAHTVFADREPRMAESEVCLELAKLFSIAVDFPKTGVPAEIPPHLVVREYPDFMQKLDKVTYESKRVIGKLFRAVRDHDPSARPKKFTRMDAMLSYDRDMEVNGFRDHLEDASFFKGEYDFKLGNLMDYYEIKTEAEILSGVVMSASKTFDKYEDGEAVRLVVRSLKKEVRGWFNQCGSAPEDETDDTSLAKASAWYHVTYHQDYWGCYNEGLDRPHFLSFPWCVYEKLILTKQRKKGMPAGRRAAVGKAGGISQDTGLNVSPCICTY